MAKPVQDSLLREIDEDIRRERYERLWKRYGWVVISLIVALVLGVAGYEAWRGYQQRVHTQSGERFAAAVALSEVDPDQAVGAFGQLAEDAPRGYAILARFRQAAILTEKEDVAAAAPLYNELASKAADPLYGELAVILRIMGAMQREISPAEAAAMAEELSPLTAEARPWRHSARELAAHLALRAGERERARALFAELSVDAEAPGGIRTRAEDMLAEIGRV